MENIPTAIEVVALALVAQDGRILMHRRPENKQHGGLWEFPGGKVELDETFEIALIREIEEELGIALCPDSLESVARASGPSGLAQSTIVIRLYTTSIWSGGRPQALEGGAVDWFTREEIAALDKPPLDRALAEQLFGSAGS